MVVLISVTCSGLLRDMAVMHMLYKDAKVHARGNTSGSRPLMPSTMLMTCMWHESRSVSLLMVEVAKHVYMAPW